MMKTKYMYIFRLNFGLWLPQDWASIVLTISPISTWLGVPVFFLAESKYCILLCSQNIDCQVLCLNDSALGNCQLISGGTIMTNFCN